MTRYPLRKKNNKSHTADTPQEIQWSKFDEEIDPIDIDYDSAFD